MQQIVLTCNLLEQLEKQRRADQELRKRVLKLEFCLQETRSQTRKLQRVWFKLIQFWLCFFGYPSGSWLGINAWQPKSLWIRIFLLCVCKVIRKVEPMIPSFCIFNENELQQSFELWQHAEDKRYDCCFQFKPFLSSIDCQISNERMKGCI
jgi:hypothetical protein